jgi:hypothetical protein
VAALMVAGCGGGSGSPTAPPGPSPPPTPTPSSNALPRVSIAAPPERVEAGEAIEISGTVEDDETAAGQLTYAWSDDNMGGVFAALIEPWRVAWSAPHGGGPRAFAFRLLVTENYQDNGAPRTQQVSAVTLPVHYNDSRAEVTRMATRFITELFSVFSVTPDEAVQDFTDTCPGKRSERRDIAGNRQAVQILSGAYSNQVVGLNNERTQATITGICEFRDIPNGGANAGHTQKIQGVCTMTAVYENWKWYLCDSKFTTIGPTVLESLRYRAPGVRNARNPAFGFR